MRLRRPRVVVSRLVGHDTSSFDVCTQPASSTSPALMVAASAEPSGDLGVVGVSVDSDGSETGLLLLRVSRRQVSDAREIHSHRRPSATSGAEDALAADVSYDVIRFLNRTPPRGQKMKSAAPEQVLWRWQLLIIHSRLLNLLCRLSH